MAPANGDFFKWEDSPGLSHHCGVCARPLANPTALQSCIGTHVGPCQKFHQQLHFIRKSHDCSSCNIGIEMHRKRHREILTAVNLVNEEDREDVSPSQVSIRAGEPLPKAGCGSKKERKMKRKSAANSVRIPMVEIFTEADYVLVSEALYGKTTWGKSGGLKDENTTGQDFAETQAKSESTPEIKRKAARGENFKKRLQKAAGKLPSSPSAPKSDPLLGVDPKIFERLGVKLAGSNKWSKIRKENLKKLANIIAQDLEITEREGQEAEMREAGFWRFVTKKTAINLAELHEQFNWSTGELKKEPKPEAL